MPDIHTDDTNAQDQELDFIELLQIVLRRKMVVISMTGAAAVISVVYSLTLSNYYTATARLLPPPKETGGGLSSMIGQLGGAAALAAGGIGTASDLYVGISRSRSVGDAVIQRLHLDKHFGTVAPDETRRRLREIMKVQTAKDTIITITAQDEDPKFAALVVNTFVDELGKTTVRLNLTKAGTERLFLEKRLEVVKRDLKAAEDALKAFSQQNKVIQVDAQAKSTIESVARLRAELATKEVRLSVLRAYQTDESAEVKNAQAGVNRLKGELAKLSGRTDEYGIHSIGNVPSLGLEYTRRLRDLKTQEAVFEQLIKQYELAKINEAKDSSALQVLDEAVVPSEKSGPRRSQIVILSVVVTFLVSLFVVFAQDHVAKMSVSRRQRLHSLLKSVFSLR